jgi:phosphatidylglycerophosphatase A
MLLRRIGVFIATCAYVGYAPVAPGIRPAIGWPCSTLCATSDRSPTVEVAVIVALAAVGLWSATEAEHHFGGIDPGPVVIDEVIGMLISLAFIPVNSAGAIVAFLIFRFLDVVKPWPARRLEQLPGGFGVVLDDMMAGIYGNIVISACWLRLTTVRHSRTTIPAESRNEATRAPRHRRQGELLTPSRTTPNCCSLPSS